MNAIGISTFSAARRPPAARAAQRGLTLIETAAALGIVALMLASFGRLTAENQIATKSRAAAIQMQEITNAAAQYIQANYSNIAAATNNGTQIAYVPVGRIHPTDADPTGTNGLPSLQAQGYLGSTFTNVNPYGQNAALAVTLDPLTLRMEGMVLTYGGQTVNDGELGRIATSIGASGGFIPSNPPPGVAAGSVMGAFGGWRSAASSWSTPGFGVAAPGHFASTLAFQGGIGQSNWLDRYNPGNGIDNSMHTDLYMTNAQDGAHNIVGANQITAGGVTAAGALVGGTVAAGSTVTAGSNVVTPLINSANGTGMTVDMNGQSVSNVATLTGASQSINGVTDTAVNITTDANVQGSLSVTNSISTQGDVQAKGNLVTFNGLVYGDKFVDSQAPNYMMDPGQLTEVAALNPGAINADTVVYGSSVNRPLVDGSGNAILPPSQRGLSCAPDDSACLAQMAAAEAAYMSAIQAQTGTARSMRLGDLLPSMVERGVFVVDSSGVVTDGQPGGTAVVFTDSNGNAIAPPASPVTAAGVIMKPSCGSNGVAKLYISKLQESYSFNLSQDQGSGPPIAVTTDPGGSINGAGGFNGPGGIPVQGYWLNGMTAGSGTVGGAVSAVTAGPVVTGVAIGPGVNMASQVEVGDAGASGGQNWWYVSVSTDGQYTLGTNGANQTVPRQVLVQTFCDFNLRRGDYTQN